MTASIIQEMRCILAIQHSVPLYHRDNGLHSFVCRIFYFVFGIQVDVDNTGNSRRPEITQTNLVDIFLFRADSQRRILSFQNVTNPSDQAGVVRAQVNDSWFGADGLRWSSQNISYPFYWVIIRSDKTLDGNQVPQPIFTAVQTTILDSVASSSSLAAASSSSVSASLASRSRSQSLASQTPTTDAQVQRAMSDSTFPRWAIAVIVVLGFLAITAMCLLTFLILRRLRRRRAEGASRNSMNSNSPMILNQDRDGETREKYDSPLLPPPAALGSSAHGHASTHDGASTDSGGLFSGADALIMAQAFRSTLRKPDFMAQPVEEGDSPGHNGEEEEEEDIVGAAAMHHGPLGGLALSKELAEEGKDIRSVSSSRGVKVETHPPEPGGTTTEETK